ncbi:MAG: NERD domain-containing protein, partial [Candidatus Aenigmatarchaeota archaeon]
PVIAPSNILTSSSPIQNLLLLVFKYLVMDLKTLERELTKGRPIEDLMGQGSWQEFEEFCESVLQEHEWKTRKNYRFKTKRRYEIDILAMKGNRILAVDCKHWGIRKGKKSQLASAIEKQKTRAKEFKKINFFMEMERKHKISPLIITWFEEDIIREKDTFVIPISKLNTFLLEIDKYL